MKMFSIVIPMYNCEKYITRAIQSVLKQTYDNFEMILVNDGSVDKTLYECQKFINGKIKIFNLPQNKGVSYARNIGLENAIGDVIVFLDADDWLAENSLEVINKNFNNSDMLVFGKIYNRKDGFYKQQLPFVGNVPTEELYSDLFKLLDVSIMHWATNKAFKLSIIKQNNLMFDNALKMGEDLDFCMKYVEKTQKISVIDEYLYFYDRTNCDSLTNSNLLSLPQRTCFNNDNIEKFLIRNNVELKNFKQYKKNLFEYVENKIKSSNLSQKERKLLLNQNKKLNR